MLPRAFNDDVNGVSVTDKRHSHEAVDRIYIETISHVGPAHSRL